MSRSVAAIIVDMQDDGVQLTGVVLQGRHKFLGVERVDTAVVGTGGDEHGRQVDPRANVMVRRVGEEPAELFGVVRGAILGDPVAGDRKRW